MRTLRQLFERNQAWSERIRQQEPDFFSKLSRQQSPSYLWIGCSDSR
ncbi:MAG TPA: carbonic anhydrase, partial [Thermoanaerobaculia bacterium]|nr:carbonic anhydrase [Thermoanaerobaculia bacterium]